MSITSTGDVTTATELLSNPPQYPAATYTYVVTWTNLGPLTTTFRAPASCSTGAVGQLIVYDYSDPDAGLVERGICQQFNRETLPWITCQPSASIYAPLYWATADFRQPYFSPGIDCPAGYSTADVLVLSSSDVSATSLQGNTLRTTGTHVFCCPSGFTSSLYSCWSPVSTATSTSLCGDDTAVTSSNVTVTRESTTFTATRYSYTPEAFSWDPSQQAITVQQWVQPVYMIHQKSDVPRESLPTTDKIVMGTVVPIVVLLAAFAAGFYFVKRSKKRSRPKAEAQPLTGLQTLEPREYPKRPAAKWHWV